VSERTDCLAACRLHIRSMIGFDSTPLRVANKGAPEGYSVLQDRGCREETMGLVLGVYHQLLKMGLSSWLSWEKPVCGVQL
jgi:hypothetical protein